MPYRSDERAPASRPESGLVVDMVRQFADPYAFLRELVQNAIDAGATRIDVTVELLPGGVALTSVDDDGSGMTRAIIEGPLLTLFSTSKEGQAGKIGKYGVGFVSVFALDPEEVTVETAKGGAAHEIRLRRDYSYELREIAPRRAHGTVVTLAQRMDSDAFRRHATAARDALERWCRHTALPITLVVRTDGEAPEAPVRIDSALDVEALVRVRLDESDARFVVGLGAAGASYAGFYNRGLLLHETTEAPLPELRGIAFKVMSASLVHTLSRDDVRRDRAYDDVLRRVVRLAKRELGAELARHFPDAARAASRGEREVEHAALVAAARLELVRLDASAIVIPLCDPLGGSPAVEGAAVMRLADLPDDLVLRAEAPSSLTRAIARSGLPVVRWNVHLATSLADRPDARATEHVEARHVLIRTLRGDEAAPSDAELTRRATTLLDTAGVPVRRVVMGRVRAGMLESAVAALAPEVLERAGSEGAVLTLDALAESERKAWSGCALVLVVGHRVVEAARAARDVAAAAHLLVRFLVLSRSGPLDASTVDRLLSAAAPTAEEAS